MGDGMVDVQGLTKVFGSTLALDAVDLRVEQGEVVALLGPNGAGKTTLLKLLATAIKPTAGGGRVLGEDLLKGRDAIRRRIGMISHNHHLYEELTAEENLQFAAAMHGMRPDGGSVIKALTEVGLDGHARAKVRTFSTGMKRRLVIGKMLLFAPELLFLDEPHNTLDQAAIALLNGYVASVTARGGAAVVATHNLSRAYAMADRFVLMRDGAVAYRVARDGLSADCLRDLYARYAEGGDSPNAE
ncbi:MAG: heme ABC exporter ATP-binding protein CcmA [candidate division NC10 bacterium]|nr:heme ABC exporter ATP-binding protein CcmA [candidate division NC10 bacterium]